MGVKLPPTYLDVKFLDIQLDMKYLGVKFTWEPTRWVVSRLTCWPVTTVL